MAGREDPRPARSRARLVDAATALLRSGGPSAVTIDAVTRAANVARATLYRHFSSGNDLVAAAFHSLMPPAPIPPDEGSLRERLVAVVVAQAELLAEAPAMVTAMSWLALGSDMESMPNPKRGAAGSAEVSSLRARIAQQYAEPFDAVFDSPDALAQLRPFDRAQAIAQLFGPVLLGKLSTLTEFDYRECAQASVDGFLAVYARNPREA